MPGLPFPDGDRELGEREMILAVTPYRDALLWADMIEAGAMSYSLREAFELPGVLLDTIDAILEEKMKLKKKER